MGIKFERITEILPAWDKRNNDPKLDYGIHCCDLRMVLKGPKGAVQFVMATGWHLPTVKETVPADIYKTIYPLAMDIGYHSPKPMYEGQDRMSSECPYLGGDCYYDGSGVEADRVMNDILIAEGSEAVWKYLEEYYARQFEG